MLVLWQLDSHKKQFRPRLGGPITKLACGHGDTYFTVSLQSNGKKNAYTSASGHSSHTPHHRQPHPPPISLCLSPSHLYTVICLLSGLDTEVEHVVGGLRKAYLQDPKQNGMRTGLVWCPRSNSLLLNSTPGFLQFYDPFTDTVTGEVRTCTFVCKWWTLCVVTVHMSCFRGPT